MIPVSDIDGVSVFRGGHRPRHGPHVTPELFIKNILITSFIYFRLTYSLNETLLSVLCQH